MSKKRLVEVQGAKLVEYLKQYFNDRKDLFTFEKHLNEQMAAYEETEKKRREEMLSRVDEPDEEGFLTIVSKRPRVFQGEQQDSQLATSEQDTLKIKPLSNFYKFNSRDYTKKAQEFQELRQKFEQEKHRLARLKETRIFKPL